MKKAKVITGSSTSNFEAKLDEWFNQNSEVTLLTVSYSCQHFENGAGRSMIAMSHEYSALIVYEK